LASQNVAICEFFANYISAIVQGQANMYLNHERGTEKEKKTHTQTVRLLNYCMT
jgi:hypothetical protein